MQAFIQNNKNLFSTKNVICMVIIVVLIIILITCLFKKGDDFGNNKTVKDHKDHKDSKYSKDNGETIIFIEMLGCGYCAKQNDEFKKNGYTVGPHKVRTIESNTPEGKALSEQYKINGFPALINLENNKMSMGFKSPDEHYTELTKADTEEEDTNDTPAENKNHIIMIGSMSCPFCAKMKTHLDSKLGENNWDFIDSSSPAGKKHMEKANATGVPLVHCTSTGKYQTGFSENVLDKLK